MRVCGFGHLSIVWWKSRGVILVTLLVPMMLIIGLLWFTQVSAERLEEHQPQQSPAESYTVEFYYGGHDAADAAAKAETFASLLAAETGFDIEASIAPCENSVVQHLGEGDVDIAAFSGAAYVRGRDIYDFEAKLANIMAGSATYRGQLNVQSTRGYTDVWSLQGTSFAASDPNSVSSYMAPYTMISTTTGIAPEDFFEEIVFTGSQRDVIIDVYTGSVDVGGTFDDARVLMTGTLTDVLDVVSVLTYTEDIPNQPWTFGASLGLDAAQSLADGIVAVVGTEQGQNAIEPFFGYSEGAAPIDDSAYDFYASIIDAFGLRAQSCSIYLPAIMKPD